MVKDASKRGRKTLKSDHQPKQHRQSRQKSHYGLHGPCQMAATIREIMNGQDVQEHIDSPWHSSYTKHNESRCSMLAMHKEPDSTTMQNAPHSLANARDTRSRSHTAGPSTNAQAQASPDQPSKKGYKGDNSEEEDKTLAQQDRVNHQNIYLSSKSSIELRRLMHDLEQLAASSSRRNPMPFAF